MSFGSPLLITLYIFILDMSLSHKLVLPDLVSTCPFNWSSHPDYERARKESSAWVESFKFFTDRKRRIFGIYNAELLAALANSYAGYEELRTCCDFYNLLFVVDELSDELNGDDTRKLGVILLRALGGEFTQGSALSRMGEEYVVYILFSCFFSFSEIIV